MKFCLPELHLGSRVQAQVVELISSDYMIVSFQGDLLRVKNESKKISKKGDWLELEVVAVKPLAFRFLDVSKWSRTI